MKKIKEYIYLYGNLTSITGFAIYWRLFNQFKEYLVENNIVQNIDLLEDIYEDDEYVCTKDLPVSFEPISFETVCTVV